MKKLKIYTDLSLLKLPGNYRPVHLLICFLGLDDFELNKDINLTFERFSVFEHEGKKFFELTTIEECDACLLPLHYPQKKNVQTFEKAIEKFANTVAKSGKPTFVFLGSDIDEVNIKIKNAIIFHYSLYQSRRRKNEYAFNFFCDDLIQKYYNGKSQLRTKANKPSVGFCGYAPPLGQHFGVFKIKESIRLLLNYCGFMKLNPSVSGHSYRVRSISTILRSRNIDKKIIIRENFAFGGPVGALFPGGSKSLNKKFREEYVNNIIDCDYTLCARGYGNYSIRLYEAMCCGRIPVILNTDCVLPYDFIIDWKKFSVWIEERDICKIPERILDFHSRLTDDEFIALQKTIRTFWIEYISPAGFYKNIHLHLHQWHMKKEN